MIGDHLIRHAYPYLQQLGDEHKQGYRNYLHEQYDHYCYYPSFTENNVLKMVRNGLVEGLNHRIKLPNAVVVLCSDQLLRDDPLFLPSELERKLKWIIKEFDTVLKFRKQSLPPKAFTLGEPRIMFVQLFQNSKANRIPREQLAKFNNLLKRSCQVKAIYVIAIDMESTFRCFDYDNKTHIAEGFKALWHEIINGIKFHDERDKQYEINQQVETRLKEMESSQENLDKRRKHTRESFKKCESFTNVHRGDRGERSSCPTEAVHVKAQNLMEKDYHGSHNERYSQRTGPQLNAKEKQEWHRDERRNHPYDDRYGNTGYKSRDQHREDTRHCSRSHGEQSTKYYR